MNNKTEKTNQLTDLNTFDPKRLIFGEPFKDAYGNNRVPISIMNEDRTVGDLLVCTEPDLYSFGFKENEYNGNKSGWVFPLSLENMDGPTESQKNWIDNFNKIVHSIKEYIVNNSEKIGSDIVDTDITMRDLRKVHPIRTKNKKGDDVKPVLNAKVIESKKSNKFVSMFFDEDGTSIDPMTIVEKPCNATAVLKIESIFFGSKTSIQVKLYEATITMKQSRMTSFLRPKSQGRITSSTVSTIMNDMKSDNEEEVDDVAEGSLGEEDDDVEKEKPKPKPKLKPRRKVKAVKREEE